VSHREYAEGIEQNDITYRQWFKQTEFSPSFLSFKPPWEIETFAFTLRVGSVRCWSGSISLLILQVYAHMELESVIITDRPKK